MIQMVLRCDFCKVTTGTVAVDTKRALLAKARDLGWSISDDKHYCPDCTGRRERLAAFPKRGRK